MLTVVCSGLTRDIGTMPQATVGTASYAAASDLGSIVDDELLDPRPSEVQPPICTLPLPLFNNCRHNLMALSWTMSRWTHGPAMCKSSPAYLYLSVSSITLSPNVSDDSPCPVPVLALRISSPRSTANARLELPSICT